jgi:molybdopterin molybdotransferase
MAHATAHPRDPSELVRSRSLAQRRARSRGGARADRARVARGAQRVLAEDVVASRGRPRFANSAMDGFAVVRGRSVDVGAELLVVGEVAAGSRAGASVGPGEAIGIMTGAPLPEGADAVVPIERVDERDGQVIGASSVDTGRHVRPAGESCAGETVLRAGGCCARPTSACSPPSGSQRPGAPQPRVAVLSTGDELVEPGAARSGQDPRLQLLHADGAGTRGGRRQPTGRCSSATTAPRSGGVRGGPDPLRHAGHLGGVSAGRYDLVKEVLADLGDVEFRKVAMRPGMPQAFGFVNGVPCFGLPGNPVSAFVSFEVFVRPAIRLLQGRTDVNRPRVTARWPTTVESAPPTRSSSSVCACTSRRRRMARRPTGEQGSGILRRWSRPTGSPRSPRTARTVVGGRAGRGAPARDPR